MKMHAILQAAVRLHIAQHAESLLGASCKISQTLPARTLSACKDVYINAFVHSVDHISLPHPLIHSPTHSLTHSLTRPITHLPKFPSTTFLVSAHMSAAVAPARLPPVGSNKPVLD